MPRMSKRYAERLAEYKKLAKKADAQMRTLERYIKLSEMTVSDPKNPDRAAKINKELREKYGKYNVLKDYAYGTAQNDIKRLYGGGSRFDRAAYKTDDKGNKKYISIDDLNDRIEAIEKFLSKPSAYLKKTKEHSSYPDALKRSAAAFSQELSNRIGYEIHLSPEDIKDLLKEADEQGLLDDYGKYEFLEALSEIQNNFKLLTAVGKIKEARINDKDIEATAIREKAQELGIDDDRSQVISSILTSENIDLSKFKVLD